MSRKGKFIVFEGIDGSGKSTQAKLLRDRLQQEGKEVYHTCEPTTHHIGAIIRNILTGKLVSDEMTIAALFLADRMDHLNNAEYGIVKMLDQGINVISDRYYFSSYAYHSVHVPMDWVMKCNALCAEVLRPDVVFYLDLDPEESQRRMAASREDLEHYEALDNLIKVRANYLEAFKRTEKEENIVSLSATSSIDQLANSIWNATKAILPE